MKASYVYMICISTDATSLSSTSQDHTYATMDLSHEDRSDAMMEEDIVDGKNRSLKLVLND